MAFSNESGLMNTELSTRQTSIAYLIAVHTEDDCRGESIDYPGDLTGCTTGLGSGGISLQLFALDADGNLTFYMRIMVLLVQRLIRLAQMRIRPGGTARY
jgi:hypothetical protein